MAIHSLRVSTSRKRRRCSICGEGVGKGDRYVARNSSVLDEAKRRVYGFFGSHLECEWAAEALGVGLLADGELSFPGFVPNVVMEMDAGELEKIDGWGFLNRVQRERVTGWAGRRKKREEPELEFQYYSPGTKERSRFKARIGELKVRG